MRRSWLGGPLCWSAFALVLLALLAHAAPAAGVPVVPVGRWPLAGSPQVLRAFAPPRTRYGPGHRGVDLAARGGRPVLASLDGRVSFAGPVAGRGVVSVDSGPLRTTYEPVAAQVVVGQAVRAGQPLGVLAAGGHCSRSCLHWGLRSGPEYLNPLLLVSGSSRVALVPAGRRRAVERAATDRARIAAAATADLGAAWVAGPGGRHGFGHPVPGAVTSPFGVRFHPVLKLWKLHDGTDFGAGCGTPIRAPSGGRVRQVVTSVGYGRRLVLDHGRVDGYAVVTAYNHAQSYVVRPGQRVTRGQLLGYVGSTGYSTGCHLHLMVWLNGRLANPMTWFSP
jgi:murein DD-endopeptidase MepM/ murein hydrolase activator NlpD